MPGGALVTSLKLKEPFPTFSTFIGYSFNSFSLIDIKVNNILNDDDVTNSFALENIKKMVFKKIEGVGFSASINTYNKYKFFNDMGFFNKKLEEKELMEMMSNPLATFDMKKVLADSTEKVISQAVSEEFKGFKA